MTTKELEERDAEIEQLQAQLKNCSAACKDAEHARNWHYQQYKKIEMKLQAHEKREAACLAFVEVFDVWLSVNIIESDAELDKVIEARERLRSVIDGMDE